MFDKICESPLSELPSRVPLDANNLLHGLLHKGEKKSCFLCVIFVSESHRRLGGGDRDALEVMEHEFFASIDFDRLKRCEITPPYVPRISGRDDTNGFDRVFTEIPINSYQPESYPNRDEGDFNGFSYRNAEHSHTGKSSNLKFLSVSYSQFLYHKKLGKTSQNQCKLCHRK